MPIDVLFVNWRDVNHPEGGGSERYVHRIAEGLAAGGLARHAVLRRPRAGTGRRGARRRPHRPSRRPPRRCTCAPWPSSPGRRPRLVVDVQNGLPFGSPLVTRAPVVVLVHHVHREQWPIVFGRLGGALGWWIESTVAPAHLPAQPLRHRLGVDRRRADRPRRRRRAHHRRPQRHRARARRWPRPGRPPRGWPCSAGSCRTSGSSTRSRSLARLLQRWPGLRLSRRRRGLVGAGTAHHGRPSRGGRLRRLPGLPRRAGQARGAGPGVGRTCAPRVKEGWGLVVSEAGSHGVPTVGYRSAGGLRESIVDGRTGMLVEDLDEMTAAVERLLADERLRADMGSGRRGPRGGVQLAGEHRCLRPRAVRRRGEVSRWSRSPGRRCRGC